MSEFLDAARTDPYRAPVATPPGDLFFTYQKPDGESFIASAANAEGYLRLGFTVTGEETLSDSDSFRDSVSPGADEPPASGVEHSEAAATPGVKVNTPPAA
jgi:hypothetical protein